MKTSSLVDKKLIAVDLDGTLFGSDHEISSRTAEVLRAVAERGHAIVVVTGRSAHSALRRLGTLPLNSRVVCANGAYEIDLNSKEILWFQALSVKSVVTIRERILDQHPQASFGWESLKGLYYEQQFIDEAGGADTLEQGGVQETFGNSELLKLYVRTPQFQRGDLQVQIEKLVQNLGEVSTSGAPFVEITAPGTDKASGLARVAAELGFTAKHVIAFGDNLNDLPMLRWAGEAVAMDNAVVAVKAIADTQALRNDQHGVAELLEQKMINGELS